MRRFKTSDGWVGLCAVVFALIVVLIWAPNDSASGLTETVRRRTSIGDALGPTVAGALILLGGVLTLLRPVTATRGLGMPNLIWLARLLAIFAISFAIMRYVGPLMASVLTDTGYRPLRNAAPWKYSGFVAGGTVMIAGIGMAVAHRFSWRLVVIGFLAALAIALAYDLPFDDLLLPPNGNV